MDAAALAAELTAIVHRLDVALDHDGRSEQTERDMTVCA